MGAVREIVELVQDSVVVELALAPAVWLTLHFTEGRQRRIWRRERVVGLLRLLFVLKRRLFPLLDILVK